MNRRRPFRPFFLALALSGLALPSLAGDWTAWRGPQHNGAIEAKGAFPDEGMGLEVVWSRPLGSGYSGLSIAENRLVTFFTDGKSDLLVALEATTGEELWRHRISAMTPGIDGAHDGPLSTPIVHGETVFGLGAGGEFFAVRLKDGQEVWRRSLVEEVGAARPHFGFTTTPLVFEDSLLVLTGGTEERAVTAFDQATGAVRWSRVQGRIDYQSPTLADLAGKKQLVITYRGGAAGLDPKNGDVLWSHPFEGNGSASPLVLDGDRFLLTSHHGATLFHLEKQASSFVVEEVWTNQSFKGNVATAVYHEGFLYSFDGDFLACVRAEDGERVWKSRPPGGKGLILVDGHLVIFGSQGDVVVAEATPEGYRERARTKVDEQGGFTAPSFAHGNVFVRNLQKIAAVRVHPAAMKESAPASTQKTEPAKTQSES